MLRSILYQVVNGFVGVEEPRNLLSSLSVCSLSLLFFLFSSLTRKDSRAVRRASWGGMAEDVYGCGRWKGTKMKKGGRAKGRAIREIGRKCCMELQLPSCVAGAGRGQAGARARPSVASAWGLVNVNAYTTFADDAVGYWAQRHHCLDWPRRRFTSKSSPFLDIPMIPTVAVAAFALVASADLIMPRRAISPSVSVVE